MPISFAIHTIRYGKIEFIEKSVRLPHRFLNPISVKEQSTSKNEILAYWLLTDIALTGAFEKRMLLFSSRVVLAELIA
ncbi:hypothetical protein BCT35_17955 [Vibrio lentus]|nr:hypothetical protein BCT75_07890 [Vibrio lentus]PMN30764.1 hypothetical protein BCT35_17955 [Vibrio lentus]